MRLSPHFTLEEFVVSQTASRAGLVNEPDANTTVSLRDTANHLEAIRSYLNNPAIIITSGYRSPEVNKLVGGSANSYHTFGLAADFIAPEHGTPLNICYHLSNFMERLEIDQLIYEYTWVHVGFAKPGEDPRHQILSLTKSGGYSIGLD